MPSNESHVMPNCVGNDRQQVLPPGIVCTGCNSYFGAKVEPRLLDYPLFHVAASFLRVVDPTDGNAFRDLIFDPAHQPIEPPTRGLDLNVDVKAGDPTRLTVHLRHRVEGTMARDLTRRDFAFLSRAIHKIALESLAWKVFVEQVRDPVDVYSPRFEPTRAWARYGQPHNTVRPVLWQHAEAFRTEWAVQPWLQGEIIGAIVELFGEWYAVNLTSSQNHALDDLRAWLGGRPDTMVIGETVRRLEECPSK